MPKRRRGLAGSVAAHVLYLVMAANCRAWLPCDAWLRMALAPALVFIALAADHGYLADFWHHLARGRAIVEQGEIVDRDLFTFTIHGESFQDVNWLAQVIYFLLFDRGGLELVRVANALLLAATLLWLVVICRRSCGSTGLAAGIAVAVFLGMWHVLTIRPQSFSFFLFVAVYDLLDRAASRPAWLLAIPPIIGLWGNLHGAFPAGIMLIGCFLLGAAWDGWRAGRLFTSPQSWRLVVCLVASLLATLVNPYGWGIYEFVGLNSYRSATRGVDEWLPPTFDLLIGKAWLASLLVMAGLAAARWFHLRQLPRARDAILVACFLPLAGRSARMVPWWLIVCAPLAAAWLAELFPRTREDVEASRRPSWGAGLALAGLTLVAILSLPGLQSYNPLLAGRRDAPRVEDRLEEVHRFLNDRGAGRRIFCRFEWGEYLSWSYSPRGLVFMDGRIDVFPDRVWDEYSAVTLGQPDWQKILDDYQVDTLLLDVDYHARSGLLPHVESSRRWRRSFQAGQAVVFLRVPGKW